MTKVVLKKWRRRLQKAIKNGEFTIEEKSKAQTWTCCAVGERDKICKGLITNDLNTRENSFIHSNFSETIFNLGMKFATAIKYDQFIQAQNIIEQIEKLEVTEFYR